MARPFVIAAVAMGLFVGEPVAQAAGPPQIGASWSNGVAASSAGLRAEINPNGLATTYHFSYIAEAAYQANIGSGADGFSGAAKAPAGADPGTGSGTALVLVIQSIAFLSPETTYRYRVVASNGSGTATGPVHSFATQGFGGGPLLLDGRGWEMVSPTNKNGGEVQGPGGSFSGGVLQAAAGGGSITYSSTSSFGVGAQGSSAGSQYLAIRGPGGWSNENITLPALSDAYGDEPDGVPHQLFSSDLARALVLDGRRCGEAEICPRGYSLHESSGGVLGSSPQEPDLWFAGATPGLGQVVLSTCAALTADAIEVPQGGGCDPASPNLYRWSSSGLALVNLLPAAIQGTPGATLASRSGAISGDGARVYWSAGGNLYLREGAVTKQVDISVGGGASFEAAATTGSPAFFTKAGHLYLYAAATGIATDLTPAGEVQGVLGASEDGSYLYYLTTAGLFLRHGATTTKIADGADPSNYPSATGTARATPDGVHLAFLSELSLTGFDNIDAVTGQPDTEVFLYDAAGSGTLTCVSCNPNGERPRGSSSIPAAIANGKGPLATRSYKPRSLSDDGTRVFFDSAAPLVAQDTGSRPDVYEWEAAGAGSCQRAGGCVGLISRGRGNEGASFVDASASGGDVFFLTADSLVGSDSGFADIYDAREGGGFPEPDKPIECAGDSCQSLPSEPEDPTPGTLIPGQSNPPVGFPSVVCKRGYVKKHGVCTKKKKAKKKKAGQRRRSRSGR